MYQLRRGYETDVTILGYDDDEGNPAPVEGDPVWATTDGTILAIVPGVRGAERTPDPMSCVLQAVGAVGTTAAWRCTADADLGAGFEAVIASEDIQIISGQATTARYAYGEARPMPTEDPTAP